MMLNEDNYQYTHQILEALRMADYPVVYIEPACHNANLEYKPQGISIVQGETFIAAVRVQKDEKLFRVRINHSGGTFGVEELEGTFLSSSAAAERLHKTIQLYMESYHGN